MKVVVPMLLPNQSEKCNCNPNLVWLNKIQGIFVWVYYTRMYMYLHICAGSSNTINIIHKLSNSFAVEIGSEWWFVSGVSHITATQGNKHVELISLN